IPQIAELTADMRQLPFLPLRCLGALLNSFGVHRLLTFKLGQCLGSTDITLLRVLRDCRKAGLAFSQSAELRVDFGDRRLVFRTALEQRPERLSRGASHLDDAEPVAMREFEAGIAALQVSPELPNSEPSLPHIDVVKEDYGAIGELWQPGFEIMGDV